MRAASALNVNTLVWLCFKINNINNNKNLRLNNKIYILEIYNINYPKAKCYRTNQEVDVKKNKKCKIIVIKQFTCLTNLCANTQNISFDVFSTMYRLTFIGHRFPSSTFKNSILCIMPSISEALARACRLFQAKEYTLNETYLTAFTKAVYINVAFDICMSSWISIPYLQQVIIMSILQASVGCMYIFHSTGCIHTVCNDTSMIHQKWLS